LPKYDEKQWNEMLNELAQRDGSVELSRKDGSSDAPPIVYRSRLFEVTPDGCIILETPKRVVQDKSFGNGDDIELTLMRNNDRLVATCTIKETSIREINAGTRTLCYHLSPGRRPQRDQRRSFFRVNVAACELAPVILKYENEDERVEFKALLVNLSAGGIGVSVRESRKLLNQIKRSRDFGCKAQLGEGIEFNTPMRLEHVKALGDDGLYLGLAFQCEDPAQKQALEDKMLQRCTQFQRQQLQRRRA